MNWNFQSKKSSCFNEDGFAEVVLIYHKIKEIQNDLTDFICTFNKGIWSSW